MILARFLRSKFAFRAWITILLLFMGGGLYAGVQVLLKGLSLTNLTDLVPWGLWITIDTSSIAIAAGAFSLCALVYLVGLKQFEPLAKTATFIGIVGYSMAMLALLMDVGRPDRFWHGFVYWNTHSVLWEVTMAVGVYFNVLIIENLPIIGGAPFMKRFFPKLSKRLSHIHHYAPILAVLGMGISLLHQSSLGATYGVIQGRPIWYKPSMAVLFIYSAVVAGISLTLFASMFAARLTNKAKVDDSIIEKVAHAIGWALLFYLYLRFWDAFAMSYTYQPGKTEGLRMLTKGSLAFNFWIGEILFGGIIPVIVLLSKNLRQKPVLRMVSLALIVGGIVAYRWDTNLVGQFIVMSYLPQEIVARYTTYTPSIYELATGFGIIAYGLLAFTVGVRVLNVVDHTETHEEHAAETAVQQPQPQTPSLPAPAPAASTD